MRRSYQFVFAALSSIAMVQVGLSQTEIYISGNERFQTGIYHATAGSSAFERIQAHSSVFWPWAVAVDGSDVYWTDYEPNRIRAGSISGGSARTVLTITDGAAPTQIEFADGHMFWNNGNGLYQADSDGSGSHLILNGTFFQASSYVSDFTVANGRVYWVSGNSSVVRSVGLDGSNPRSFTVPGGIRLFSIDSLPGGLAIADVGYSNREGVASVWTTDFNGGALQRLVSQPLSTTIDLTALSYFDGRVYWGYRGDAGDGALDTSFIESVNLDGTGRRVEFSTTSLQIYEIDVVPSPGSLLAGALVGGIILKRRHR